MTKDNLKENLATKVAKVSNEIKAATAEVEGSTAIKVNTGKSVKTTKSGAKNDSIVKVNIQKDQSKKTAPKTTSKPQTAKVAGQTTRNSRILNVVELGDSGQSGNKAIDGMVKSSNNAKPPMASSVSTKTEKPVDKADAESVDRPAKKSEKSAKKHKNMSIIVLVVLLMLGIIAGAVVWVINLNNRGTCTVEFESNGGSKVEDMVVVCGGKIDRPEDPEKDGFEFREWAYRGKKFDFDSSTIDEDIILVAKWNAADDTEVVTISFDSNGGSKVEDMVIKAGTATMAPVDPTREGYTFEGWYLGNKKFDFSQALDEDIILVAKWSGGASNTAEDQQPSQNQNSTTNDAKPTTQKPSSNTSSSSSGNSGNSSSAGGSGEGNGSATSGGKEDIPSGNGEGSGGNGDETTSPGDNGNVPSPDSNAQD